MQEEKKKFDKVAYNNSYIAQAYDRINLTVPKGEKDRIKVHAEARNESVNSFIQRAIKETMQRDECAEEMSAAKNKTE